MMLNGGFHTLICGRTGSGKSLYARIECLKNYYLKKRQVLICLPDEVDDDWGIPKEQVLTDPYEMLYYAKKNYNCLLVFDEAGEQFARSKVFNYFATRSRHNGHDCIFIAQRLKMLLPEIRSNCRKFVSFSCIPSDAKIMHEETGKQEFLKAVDFETFEGVEWKGIGKEVKKINIKKDSSFKNYLKFIFNGYK